MFPFDNKKKEISLGQNREKTGYEEIITFAAGEISITMFERVYKGEAEYKAVDWEAEAVSLFSKYMPGIVKIVQNYADKHGGSIDPRKLGEMLSKFFKKEY